MNELAESRFSRRQFIAHAGGGLAACALQQLAPRLVAATASASDEPRALVVIQLEGGNDGWNTIVPFRDERYFRLRPTLALASRDLIALSESAALNPAVRALEPLFKDGKLAIIANVGSTPQSASHFRATEIWHTGSAPDEVLHSGWAGRCLEHLSSRGREVCASHAIETPPRIFLRDGDRLSYVASAGRDGTDALAEIGERAALSGSTEIHFVSIPGFDTHFRQTERHGERLLALANALHSLQLRLKQRGVERRVVTMVFSEFGRTLAENAQGGTDHGGGALVFLLGAPIRGGFFNGDSASEPMDYRRVLATLTNDWLRVPSAAVFGGAFPSVEFLPNPAS